MESGVRELCLRESSAEERIAFKKSRAALFQMCAASTVEPYDFSRYMAVAAKQWGLQPKARKDDNIEHDPNIFHCFETNVEKRMYC